MNNKKYEEMLYRMALVYEIIKQGFSIRECKEYLEDEYGIIVSHVTVKNDIDRWKKFNVEKYNEIQKVILNHKEIDVRCDEAIRTRVRNVVVMLDAGYTFKEIAENLKETEFTVYRDYKNRLNLLTNEELNTLGITKDTIDKIDSDLKERRLANLKNSKKM